MSRLLAITTVFCMAAATPAPSLARGVASADAVSLAWSAPPGCVDADAFDGLFASALELPLADYAAAGTRIDVTITERAGWSVSVVVTWRGARRTRTLSVPDDSCRALDEALIVVIALLVEDAGALASAPADPPPIALPAAPARVIEAPDALRLGGRLALGGTARIDALPGFAAGVTLGGELQLGSVVALGISATYFAPTLQTHADGVGTEASATGGTLYACALGAPHELLLLGGCAGVSAWAVSAAGTGLSEARTSLGFALDVSAQARAHLRLVGPLWLRLEVGVGIGLVRARIEYEVMGALQTFHTTSIAFPTASLFLEVLLGDD